MTIYEKPIRLTCEEMYNLGAEGSNRKYCSFDFSFLSIDDYQGFFNTLPNMIYKKCESLRFCNDFERSLEERNLRTDSNEINQDFKTYEYSIRFKKPGYSNFLAKIIGKALPRTKLLTSLEFDQIPFSGESFRHITDAVKKTRMIKSITFANLKIEDTDFIYFLNNISPYRLDSITFINCHITGSTYDALNEYIHKKPSNNDSKYQPKFAKLILKGNGIKYNQKTGEIYRRFKPDDVINERDIIEINMNWDDENENDQNSATQMLLELRRLAATVKAASPTNDLRRQNENLKKELNELLYVIKAVKYDDDVYFVGEDADACVQKIKKVENVVQDYESKHGGKPL